MKTSDEELEIDAVKQDRRGRRITLPERRAALVAGYRSNGLTMEQYAKAEGIKRHTLANWVNLHDQRAGAGASFAQVNMVPVARPSWAYELVLPNGWVVRAADATAVAQLLGVVQA